MEPFKNIYNKNSIKIIAAHIKRNDPSFDDASFSRSITPKLSQLELKDRVRLIADTIHNHNNKNYKKNLSVLIRTLAPDDQHLEKEWDNNDTSNGLSGFLAWPIAQYIEDYGLDHFPTSLQAIKEVTKRFTGEFAIRPFIQKDSTKVLSYLEKWVKDKNHHVRRLVSEGTRPNLPWGMKVEILTNNPNTYIHLLDHLYDDESEYVRRSVANHMNDLSRHHPKLFYKLMQEWSKRNKSLIVQKSIRHACRSELKKGSAKALKLLGYKKNINISIKGNKLSPKKIKEGDNITLEFKLKNLSSKKEPILIDYIISYLKNNGTYSKKVFRLKDTTISPSNVLEIKKIIKFKKVTTRVHYSGTHHIEVQVNGQILSKNTFELKVPHI